MKFAKELEQDLVPEWRAKYFNYKTGKKKVQAVARAIKNADRTPRLAARHRPSVSTHPNTRTPLIDPIRSTHVSPASGDKAQHFEYEHVDVHHDQLTKRGSSKEPDRSATSSAGRKHAPHSKSSRDRSRDRVSQEDSDLRLPKPALGSGSERNSPSTFAQRERPDGQKCADKSTNGDATKRSSQSTVQLTSDSVPQGLTRHASLIGIQHPKSQRSLPSRGSVPFLKRLFAAHAKDTRKGDVPVEAYREIDALQSQFFQFLDAELAKIEDFYDQKELQAGKRLRVLEQQLLIMRDRRLDEMQQEKKAKATTNQHSKRGFGLPSSLHETQLGSSAASKSHSLECTNPMPRKIGNDHLVPKRPIQPEVRSKTSPPSKPVNRRVIRPPAWQDFVKKQTRPDEVTYRSAKRKLKLAMQEFYRALELLRSYALLNRTAFRKITKKYDKAAQARLPSQFMNERVNKAWFVQSQVLENHIVQVENLYARYFESGNHHVAVRKLRSKISKVKDVTRSVFRNGLFLAAAVVLGIEGLVQANTHLQNPSPIVRLDTSYLLQIYGGYFLMLLLFLLFCVNCKIWTDSKINYPFIFEFDNRHTLDWHQLSELPCSLLFLLALFLWLNFTQPSESSMFVYWPVILIGLSVFIIFFPAPMLYHRSRNWWSYSNFRLLLSGIYPVEFRDFFLGDMYCSVTYSMGNLELFFCLYAHYWNDPGQCNSNHSRLLGFFAALPAVWRALQCLRRYWDTRNAFPHLVNGGKYTFTILTYMSLSLYRIDKVPQLRSLFIAFATINSIYCSVWDLAMDWSLCNPMASHPLLRDVLGYDRPWIYYLAMILDPILRFNWIFYAIFSHDLQHSAILAFFVSFSEVIRRGIWTAFRVENEHCTNVGRFRASRDVPLPYEVEISEDETENVERRQDENDEGAKGAGEDGQNKANLKSAGKKTCTTGSPVVDPSNLERQQTSTSTSADKQRRSTLTGSESPLLRGIGRVGTAINTAHAQDFERRRPRNAHANGPGASSSLPTHQMSYDDSYINDTSSEEEGNDEEDQDNYDAHPGHDSAARHQAENTASTFRNLQHTGESSDSRRAPDSRSSTDAEISHVRDVVERRGSGMKGA